MHESSGIRMLGRKDQRKLIGDTVRSTEVTVGDAAPRLADCPCAGLFSSKSKAGSDATKHKGTGYDTRTSRSKAHGDGQKW